MERKASKKVLTIKPGSVSRMKTLTKLLTTLKSTQLISLRDMMLTKEQLLAKKEMKTLKLKQANATSSSTSLDVFSLKLPKLKHAMPEDPHPTLI